MSLASKHFLSREYHRRYIVVLGAYHPGLWTNFAATGFLSYVKKPEFLVAKYRAPSWSWASVEGTQYTDLKSRFEGGVDLKDLDIEVLHIESTLAENSPLFGIVTHGYMEIKAILLDVY